MNVRKEDFAVPAKLDCGDVDKDAIHLAVGQALHFWEKTEHFLGELYAAVLGAVVPVGALRAYGSVTAFTARQTMLMEAADALWYWAPNDGLEKHFTSLVRTVGSDAAARRAEIAHGLVISENDENNFFLVPSFHSSRKRDSSQKPKYAYTSDQIDAFRDKFDILAGDVYQLQKKVQEWRDASTKQKRADARKPTVR